VSGNVSLYNETEGVGVFPTPSIVMVGLNDDADKTVPSFFQKEGNSIYLLGDTHDEFGGSLYLKLFANAVKGELSKIDYDKELKLWELVIEANKKGLISAAKDINTGGIAVSLAKMSALSGIGAVINTGLEDEKLLFSESFSRAVVEVKDEKAFEELAKKIGLHVRNIGKTGGERVVIDGEIDISVAKTRELYFNSFKKLVEQDL
jgi:phosphoribosylformylglycinamidine synthase